LFDGANSAVLLQETRTRRDFRIALPQTGQFSDLKPGEPVLFSFDPERAVCFRARPAEARPDVARPDVARPDAARPGAAQPVGAPDG
jgi:spermidine/putrescine transport system ATP-binding protein